MVDNTSLSIKKYIVKEQLSLVFSEKVVFLRQKNSLFL